MQMPGHNNQTNYEQIRVLSKIAYSEDYCNQIISKLDGMLDYKEQHSEDGEVFRSVYIKDIDISDIDRLRDEVLSANFGYYNFNLNAMKSDCFFARYGEGMHYQALHMDCIAGEHQRKLTFTLLLNDNFTGGDFQLLDGSIIEKKKGKLLILPSFLAHKVTPVTSGTRYAIFGWFYGPNFI